jgi:LysM repeat protein
MGWDHKLGNGGRIGKVCVGRFARDGKTRFTECYFQDVAELLARSGGGKLSIEKDVSDFISAMSLHPPVGKPHYLHLMTALRTLVLSTICLVLASCENTKSTSSDPYASNYGNDGHYNPYPGQSGYASSSTPTYQKPPMPVELESPADPYAFNATNKTSPGNSSDPTTKKTTASSSPAKKKSTPSKSTTKKSSSGSRYAVSKGDTLYGIALKKKTTIAKLKAANGLKNDLIRPGQSLKIP